MTGFPSTNSLRETVLASVKIRHTLNVRLVVSVSCVTKSCRSRFDYLNVIEYESSSLL